MAATSLFPADSMRLLFKEWMQRDRQPTDKLAALAGLKDFIALVEIVPHNLQGHSSYTRELGVISASVASTCAFIKTHFLGAFEDAARIGVACKLRASNKIYVQSPLAGGVPYEHVHATKGPIMKPLCYPSIGVGLFNPGRSGLSTL